MSTELEQLIEAVQRQPGSRAFALLAARYLAEGAADRALSVCAEGFAVNPAYERGAVVYLQALRANSDVATASEVYGRAIAESPRSVHLRVAWARILLDAGREYEAKLRVREAAEIDPGDKEVRAMLTNLGDTIEGSRRTTSGLAMGRPLSGGGGGATDGIRQKVAALRPRLSLGISDKRFDFTPVPHGPVQATPGTSEAPALDELADFFNAPTPDPLPEAAPPSPRPQAAVVTRPKPQRAPGSSPLTSSPKDLAQDAGATVDDAGITDLSEDIFALHDEAAAAPPPPPLTPAPAPEPPAERGDRRHSKNLFTIEGDIATDPSPQMRPTSPTGPAPAVAQRRKRRILPLVLSGIAAVVLVVGPVTGVVLYRKAQRDTLRERLRKTMGTLISDDLGAWARARSELCSLADGSRESSALQVSCALVTAHLAGRFQQGEAKADSRTRLAQAERLAPTHPWTLSAAVLLANNTQNRQGPASKLRAIPQERVDWHAALALALTEQLAGRIKRAQALLDSLVRGAAAPAAAMALGARLARLQGDGLATQRFLRAGLATAPQHAGLLLQQALFEEEARRAGAGSGEDPTKQQLAALRARTQQFGPYLSDLALLEARIALRHGQRKHAIDLAKRAVAIGAGSRPEAAWLLGLLELQAGGQAKLAVANFMRAADDFLPIAPRGHLPYAQALLLAGRATEARTLLEGWKVRPRSGEADAKAALLVSIAQALEDTKSLRRHCGRSKHAAAQQIAACAEATTALAPGRRAHRWIRRLPKGPQRAYVEGLEALSRGDAPKAAATLAPLIANKSSGVATKALLALARALLAQRLHGQALPLAERAIQQDSASARAQALMIDVLISAGRDSDALTRLDQLAESAPTDPQLLAAIGRAYLGLGKSAAARAVFQRGTRQHPDSNALAIASAEADLAAGKLDSAVKSLGPVLKRDQQSVSAQLVLGKIAARRGQASAARRHFALALRVRPNDPDLRLEVAVAHAQAKLFKTAGAHGGVAIKTYLEHKRPDRAIEAAVQLSQAFRRGSARELQRAADMLYKMCKHPNATAALFFEFGLVYHLQRDLNEAVWALREALKRDPKHAPALLKLGEIQWSKRAWRTDAKRTFRRYLALAPEGSDAKRVRRLLR